jgi:hypothetical protein
MKNRWVFKTFVLALAGLLVSTFATPSQAGSTLVTTDASFLIAAPAGATATDFEFQFNSVDPITDLTVTSTNLPATVISEGGANEIIVNFGASNAGFVDFSFMTSAPAADVGVLTFFLTGASVPIKDSTLSVVVNANAVPEPASLALLGIGMTGFLAFRRFFKKTPVT